MATTSDLVRPVSGTNSIDALMEEGPFWNYLTPQRSVIYYCFATGDVSGGPGYTERPFSAEQITNAKLALAEAARVTGIHFCQVTDQTQADITFANTNISGSGVTGLCWWNYGYSYNPSTTVLTNFWADSFVYMDDTDYDYTDQTNPGGYGFEVLLHELGHALGLKHPFDGSDGAATLPTAEDNTGNTLMSYTHVGGNHSLYQAYDIAALQYLYGTDGLGGLTGLGATGNTDIIGGDPADDIDGTSSGENISGNGGNDILRGLGGNDTLSGGSGNDTLNGGAGADYLVGGDGRDTISYADASAGLTVSLDWSGSNTGEATNENYTGVENVLGSAFADSLVGDGLNNVLTGGGGDDTLSSMDGWDTLDGGEGNDRFLANAGAESFIGGNGVDTADYSLAGASVAVWLSAGTGAGWGLGDTIGGVENLSGSAYADALYGNALANRLSGSGGNDTLSGLGGADTLDGGVGNDWFVANSGVESFVGGDGSDTVAYTKATAGVTVRLWGGAGAGFALGDVFNSVENVTGSINADALFGDALANRLSGAGGNDSLSGMGGADTLDGGAGNDWFSASAGAESFIGGAGTDGVGYGAATAGVTVRLSGGTNTGLATGHRFNGVENVSGSEYADALYGDTAANRLLGGLGNDTLSGLGGADTLDGGAGDDWLAAGAGAESFIGGAGADTVAYGAATASVTARLSGGAGAGFALNDTYNGVENLAGSNYADGLYGNASANRLSGNGGDDSLSGLGGADTLDGGAGNDTLVANAGAESLIGGAGLDTVSYATATAGVMARLSGGAGSGFALGDTFGGVEYLAGSTHADTLGGDAAANRLTGGAGDDLLFGKDGNDVLVEGAGRNMLLGGAGNDNISGAGFVYGDVGADTIITGSGNTVLAGGTGNDTLNTDTGAKVILYNQGDGADVVTCNGSTLDDTLSLGGGITAYSLSFSKSGDNLVLNTGAGNTISFSNWYAATAQKSILRLQLIEEAAADYNPSSTEAMLNKKFLTFSFGGLVDAFDAARAATPGLVSWSLSGVIASTLMGANNTTAAGGDFAHEYGLHGNFNAIGSTGAGTIMANANYCTNAQTLLATADLGAGTRLVG